MMLLQRIACKDGIAALPNWSINEGHGLSLASVKLRARRLKAPTIWGLSPPQRELSLSAKLAATGGKRRLSASAKIQLSIETDNEKPAIAGFVL